MSRYWLPDMNPNAQMGDNASIKVGQFIPTSTAAITSIADNLLTTNLEPKDLRSIPNVWARAMAYKMFFEEAYNNPNQMSAYCRSVVGEWRGLLAAIVLRQHYNIEIQFEMLEENVGSFMQAAWGLLPPEVAFIGDSWGKSALIYCNYSGLEIQLGMTSPTTVVCASAEQSTLLPFPWHKENRFIDPLSLHNIDDALSQADIIVLTYWLDWAIQNLQANQQRSNPNIAVCLLSMLEAYKDDIKMVFPINKYFIPGDPHGTPSVQFNMRPQNLIPDNIMLQLLNASYSSSLFCSDLMLNSKNQRSILLKEEEAIDSVVFGIYDVLAYRRYPQLVDQAIKEHDRSIQLITMSELFLPKLTYLLSNENLIPALTAKGMTSETPAVESKFKINERKTKHISQLGTASQLVSSQTNMSSAIILPLTRFSFSLINDLRKDVFVVKSEKGLFVRTKITLENGKLYPIEQYYSFDQDMIEIEHLPMAAIWPKYEIKDWEHYYLYCGDQNLRYHFDLVESSAKTIPYNRVGSSSGEPFVRYTMTDHFPDCLECLELEDHLGYLVLSKPEIISKGISANKICFGIDFGTSASSIHYSIIDSNNSKCDLPKQLTFSSSLALVSCDSEQIKLLVEYFMSPFEIPTPFPTIVHVSQISASEPFTQANLFYYNTRPSADDRLINKDRRNYFGQLKAQVKWAVNEQDKDLSNAVIAELVMQTALYARIEGYSKIEWRFSYPLSLPDTNEFKEMCKMTVERFGEKSGLQMDKQNLPIVFLTESEASARHFKNSHFNYDTLGNNITVIDIGGGSTDIFLLSSMDGKLQSMETSVPFGARNMLIDLLFRNKKFFINLLNKIMGNKPQNDLILDKMLANGNTDIEALDMESFYMLVETLLASTVGEKKLGNSLSEYVIENRNESSNDMYSQIRKLRTIIALYMAAVFYYCGMIIRYSRAGLPEIFELPEMSVCIAGNGSKVMDWIEPTKYAARDSLAFYDSFLTAGSGAVGESNSKLRRSNKPKTEASSGLVSESITYDGDTTLKIEKVILAGLNFNYGPDKTAADHLTNVLSKEIEYATSFKGLSDLTEVERFLTVFNHKASQMSLNRIEIVDKNPIDNVINVERIPKRNFEIHLNDRLLQRAKINQNAINESKQAINRESFFITAIREIIETKLFSSWNE